MPAKRQPWFRMYSEMLSDRKINRVCKRSRQAKPTVIGVWTMILCMAGESPERGVLLISKDMPFTIDEIIDELDMEEEMAMPIIDEMVKANMLSFNGEVYSVTNWDKRQFKNDSSTERVAEWRRNQKEQKKNSTTPPDHSNNGTGRVVESDDYTQHYNNVDEASAQPGCNVATTPPESESDTESFKDNNKNAHVPHACEAAETTEPETIPDYDDGSDLGFPPRRADSDPEYSRIQDLYLGNIGPIGSIMGQELGATVDDIRKFVRDKHLPADETPESWFQYAIQAAVNANALKWSYVKVVLDSIETAGSLATRRIKADTSSKVIQNQSSNGPRRFVQQKPMTVSQKLKQAPRVAGEF